MSWIRVDPLPSLCPPAARRRWLEWRLSAYGTALASGSGRSGTAHNTERLHAPASATPPPPTFASARPHADALPRSLGAAVLSHHVDEFSLVSAFFLFSVGCVNILLGLIFRESAKARRALAAWHDRYKGAGDVLPTARPKSPSGPRPLVMSAAAWDKEHEAYGEGASRAGSLSSQKSGMGFGRQGEKAALARGACLPLYDVRVAGADEQAFAGFTLQRPAEALPTYVPKPTASTRHSSAESTSGDSETAV